LPNEQLQSIHAELSAGEPGLHEPINVQLDKSIPVIVLDDSSGASEGKSDAGENEDDEEEDYDRNGDGYWWECQVCGQSYDEREDGECHSHEGVKSAAFDQLQ
jgi:hypothetical protein